MMLLLFLGCIYPGKGFYSRKILLNNQSFLLQRLLHLKLDLSGFYFHVRSNLDLQIHIFQDYYLIVLPFTIFSLSYWFEMSPFSYNKFSHIIKLISSFWYFSFRDASISPYPLPIAKNKYYIIVLIFLNYKDFQFCILIASILYIFLCHTYYPLLSTM